MKQAAPLSARQWAALGVALIVLNAALTFGNVWPTLWVVPRPELSIELGVLLLALVVLSAFVKLGTKSLVALTVLVLALVLGRYAEVTAPALYGRPVNLYWDSQHLPKVAAMLAEVGPWWLVTALAVGVAALFAALCAGIAWCLRSVTHALRVPRARLAVGAVAVAVVAVYALGRWLDWPTRYRYALPVAATYLQQARFVLAAASSADSSRNLPAVPLPSSNLARLKGDDLLLLFLESYGAVTYDEPTIARTVAPARDELAHAAAETGRQVVSAFASSPTFGGGSWLAHASFMSGVEVRDTGDYMLLLTQRRETWATLFRAAGYRTIAVMPGLRSAWPEGAFYHFDAIYDELALDYRGPEFGWWRIPDQYSLARIGELKRASDSHAPLLTFMPTINTHIPFLPVPPYQADWKRVLTDDPYPAGDVEASLAQAPDWEALGGPYADSFVYTFTYLAGYLRERGGVDETLVLLGDHQPAASVAGVGARWDVPVHVVTRRADIAAKLLEAGFVEGVALAPQQRPIVTLPELSALLLDTFAAQH